MLLTKNILCDRHFLLNSEILWYCPMLSKKLFRSRTSFVIFNFCWHQTFYSIAQCKAWFSWHPRCCTTSKFQTKIGWRLQHCSVGHCQRHFSWHQRFVGLGVFRRSVADISNTMLLCSVKHIYHMAEILHIPGSSHILYQKLLLMSANSCPSYVFVDFPCAGASFFVISSLSFEHFNYFSPFITQHLNRKTWCCRENWAQIAYYKSSKFIPFKVIELQNLMTSVSIAFLLFRAIHFVSIFHLYMLTLKEFVTFRNSGTQFVVPLNGFIAELITISEDFASSKFCVLQFWD